MLLGSSDTCNIEMFAIDTRLFCMQAHPDFNQSVQEEINEGEYVIGKMIHDQSHKLSWAISGQRFFSDKSEMRETRNLIHALTREFFEF
jgi:GMP synthase-like glutamine amidotransferase